MLENKNLLVSSLYASTTAVWKYLYMVTLWYAQVSKFELTFTIWRWKVSKKTLHGRLIGLEILTRSIKKNSPRVNFLLIKRETFSKTFHAILQIEYKPIQWSDLILRTMSAPSFQWASRKKPRSEPVTKIHDMIGVDGLRSSRVLCKSWANIWTVEKKNVQKGQTLKAKWNWVGKLIIRLLTYWLTNFIE